MYNIGSELLFNKTQNTRGIQNLNITQTNPQSTKNEATRYNIVFAGTLKSIPKQKTFNITMKQELPF